MGRKLENDELGAEAVVPSPFTGKHWDAYQLAMTNHRQYGRISQSYHGALAIIESGHYRLDNGDLANIDEDAPLGVLAWLGSVVAEYIADLLELSKN